MSCRCCVYGLAVVGMFIVVTRSEGQVPLFEPRAATSQDVVNRDRWQDIPQNTNVRQVVNQDLGRGLRGTGARFPTVFSRAGSAPTGTANPGSRTPTKPFTYATQRPTVSPYMNQFRTDLEGGAGPNYQTLVRPQLNQMRINQDTLRRQQQVYRQLQSLQSRSAFPVQGSENLFATGHQTVFMNYLHYYPAAQAAARR